MPTNSGYAAEVYAVRRELRSFDSPAGMAIPTAQHLDAIEADVRELRRAAEAGKPLEAWRLRRIAARSVLLMAECGSR